MSAITLTDLKPHLSSTRHLAVRDKGIIIGHVRWETWPESTAAGYRFKPSMPGPRCPQVRPTSLLMMLIGPDFNLSMAHACTAIAKMNRARFKTKRRHVRQARPHVMEMA